MDLLARLNNHEDNLVERKPDNVNARQIRKTLVGFANSVVEPNTGVLFIGIHDKGQILGVKNPDDIQKTVEKECQQVCYPPINYKSFVLPVDGKQIVAIEISESNDRPHFSGPAFIRSGSSTRSASESLFRELIDKRHSKVNKILSMRNKPVTVYSRQHVLGKDKIVNDPRHSETVECLVIDCDTHLVTLRILTSDRTITEPLEAVSVSYDHEKHRPKLLVRGLFQ